jgi:hypothetical protein
MLYNAKNVKKVENIKKNMKVIYPENFSLFTKKIVWA